MPALPKSGRLDETEGELIDSIVMGGINGYAISSYTEYPRAALAFLNYATSYEMVLKRNEYLGIAPARADCNEDCTVQADKKLYITADGLDYNALEKLLQSVDENIYNKIHSLG